LKAEGGSNVEINMCTCSCINKKNLADGIFATTDLHAAYSFGWWLMACAGLF
jgi:hypothetical protein